MKSYASTACLCAMAVSAGVISLAGCAGTTLFSKDKTEIREATAAEPAVEVLCIWQPAEGQGLNKKPSRGFNGQIMFFTRKRSQPVKVDGDVLIYLFDDRGEGEAKTKPIHQFAFPADAWQTHMVVGKLGPAYQLFIPYTRSDRYKANCAVRVRLTSKEGAVADSELSTVVLPGPEVPAGADGKPATAEKPVDKASAAKPRTEAPKSASKQPTPQSEQAKSAAPYLGRDAMDFGARHQDEQQTLAVTAIGELHPLGGGKFDAQPASSMGRHPLDLASAPVATEGVPLDASPPMKLRPAGDATQHVASTRHPLSLGGSNSELDEPVVKQPRRLSDRAVADSRPLGEPHPLARRSESDSAIQLAGHESPAEEEMDSQDSESADEPIETATPVRRPTRSTNPHDPAYEGVRTADWEVPAREN